MTRRMVIALLSLGGVFLATYLYLYKLGLIGTLACGTGDCELVQTSRYARFGGIEVSLIGIGGYLSLLVVSLVALQDRWAARRGPALVLTVLAGLGVLFALYLTSLELFVIHAICRWCVGSAAIIAAIFILALLDLRRTPAWGAAPASA